MNKIVLNGRFTKDPEVRYGGANNSAVAKFTLASERRIKKEDQPTADFIPCIAFGKTAEFIEKYAKKGGKFLVDGHMTSGSYVNNAGKTVYTLECTVDSTEFDESSKGNNNSAPDDSFLNLPDIPDEDLPFN